MTRQYLIRRNVTIVVTIQFRDTTARGEFRKEKDRGSVLTEKYILDIIREGWKNDDYYQWITGKRFEDIVKGGLTLSKVFSMYILHEADESKFVEAANDILKRNQQIERTKLYHIRKARGFTQQQLSDASGVTLRMIQLYEQRQNDINRAQVRVVVNLAKVLGCDVEDLLEHDTRRL